MKVSIVSPVYRAEKILHELVRRIQTVFEKTDHEFEIVLVEDHSPDNSWTVIEGICTHTPEVKGIKLSRNFGQHHAVTAGVAEATGDVIVLMDCDLQDNPNHILSLIEKYEEGYDIVFTKRQERKHSFFKRFTAFLYNSLYSLLSDKKYDTNVGSLTLFSKKVQQVFNQLKEQDRLYIQLLKWMGFSHTYVEVEHNERYEGTSSYNLSKLLAMAVRGWTSHSDKLLRLSIYFGLTLSGLAFIGIITVLVKYFLHGFQSGWPSIFVLILFSTGVILISIGVTGIYIGKIFEQVKDRPLYIIDKKLNL